MKKYLLPKTGFFYKANMHCHTTLSDGKLTPQEIKEHYKNKGYSVVAFTDHDIFIPHPELKDDNFLPLNGFEVEINQENTENIHAAKTCHICFVALNENITEQPMWNPEYLFGNAPKNAKLVKYNANVMVCLDTCHINDAGYVDVSHENNDSFDKYRFKTRNYFRTEEEAEEYQEIINTYYDLMDLAEELNNGEKIDWNDNQQCKYTIYYDFEDNFLNRDNSYVCKEFGQIYCLDGDFPEKAIEKIGKDKLIKLFKYERG